MRMLWWIPITIAALGTGLFLRVRRRQQLDSSFTTGAVSSDWLAHARGHEEQEW